ncbi:hypothetical protein Tco_1532736 [Tanacetum coccineum]
MTSKVQQIELDNALVAPENRRVIGECNMRINLGMKPKEPTYQVVLDALALTTCYPAFLITAKVPVIYMHQFWATVSKHSSSYRFKIDNKRFYMNVEVFREILNICPKVLSKAFDEPPTEEDALSFIRELGYTGEIKFTKIIIHHFLTKDKSISMRNRMFMHTGRDDSLLGTMRFVYRHADTQKFELAISSEESPSKKKPAKAKKDAATKPKPTKKKALEATKRSKKEFHALHASGLGDGINLRSEVPDEQHHKTSDSDEEDDDEDDSGDESDDGDNDDDDCDKDVGDNNDGKDDDEADSERTESDREEIPDLNQSNEEHEQEEEDVDERVHTPDDYELTDEENINDEDKIDEEENDDIIKELYKDVNVNLGNEDAEMIHDDQGGADEHNVPQESGFVQEEEDAHMTLTTVHDSQKTKGPMQSSSVSSDFTSKLLNLENISPADNEIASLMDTTIHHEEPSSQTSSLHTVPITVIPEVTSTFTTTIPPPPPFFNPLQQHATLTPKPTTSEATTSFTKLLDFSSVFKFNERVTNLEHDLSEMKQVDQEEAQAEKQEYIDLVDTSVRTILKEEVKTQLPQILPKAVSDFATSVIKKNITESLEAAVLAKSSSQPKSTYEAAASLLDSKEKKSSSTSKGTSQSQHKSSGKSAHAEEPSHTVDDSGVQHNQEFDMGHTDDQPNIEATLKRNCQVARAEDPPTSFDKLYNTPINFFAFFLNRLNITDLTQEILVGPVFNLLKGTCKSLTELEYHFEECSKATTKRRDWHNLEGKPYPFDLRGSLSRQYSTSVTKTKAATYEIKWIEDMVPNLWSPVKVVYDKHAYWVTRLKIIKKYDYGHSDEIEVRKED